MQKELKDAMNIFEEKLLSDIFIIPLRLEDCQIPLELLEIQYVNIYENNGWEKLIHAIELGIEQQNEEHVLFEENSLKSDYEIVENIVLYKGSITDIDGSTFQIIDSIFSKDNKYVYCQTNAYVVPLRLLNVEADSFRKINDQYYSDSKHIYIMTQSYIVPMILHDIDVRTFKILDRGYHVDKNNVYKLTNSYIVPMILHDVDAKTFKVVNHRTCIDAQNSYIDTDQYIIPFRSGSKELIKWTLVKWE